MPSNMLHFGNLQGSDQKAPPRDRSAQAVGHYQERNSQGPNAASGHPNVVVMKNNFFNLPVQQQNQTMLVPSKLLKQVNKQM